MPDIKWDHTIAAVATPIGEGGLGVIRVSGEEAIHLVEPLFRNKQAKKLSALSSHTVHFGDILDQEGHLVDQVLITLFKAPQSYTGEDVVEISAHGGVVVTKRILGLLIDRGASHAEPGEFTKRAFLNGKLDLTQAEAVLDVIKAKSDKSAETAVKQLSGTLSNRFQDLKERLMTLYAHMEAFVDFPEEDIEVYEDQKLSEQLRKLEEELARLIDSFKRGSLLREGVSVVLVGKPNVGKSSLFNALLERDRAIVSELPGTTRDALQEWIQIEGISGKLTDTAGLDAGSAGDPLEALSMKRTREAIKEADLFLYILEGSTPLTEADRSILDEIKGKQPFIPVINKCDLALKLDLKTLTEWAGNSSQVQISTKTGQGFEALEHKMAQFFQAGTSFSPGEQITRLRHKQALEEAHGSLLRAHEALRARTSLELVTVDIQAALQALQELIGEIYSEDLLDVIFSEFCIGK